MLPPVSCSFVKLNDWVFDAAARAAKMLSLFELNFCQIYVNIAVRAYCLLGL